MVTMSQTVWSFYVWKEKPNSMIGLSKVNICCFLFDYNKFYNNVLF